MVVDVVEERGDLYYGYMGMSEVVNIEKEEREG